MKIRDYFAGGKNLSHAVILNVVGLAVFTQLIEMLVSKGILPRFETPGSIYELVIFMTIFSVILCLDLIVWRCADNARYGITKVLGKLYATKGLLFLLFVFSVWIARWW